MSSTEKRFGRRRKFALLLVSVFAGFILAIGTPIFGDSWLLGNNYLYPNGTMSDNVNVTGNFTVDGIAKINGQLICLANGTNCVASTNEALWQGNSTKVCYSDGTGCPNNITTSGNNLTLFSANSCSGTCDTFYWGMLS